MRENATRKLARMGRRRFLKTLAGFGVSGAALNHMTQEALAETNPDLNNEVPLLRGMVHANHQEVLKGAPPKRKPLYFTVSRNEWVVIDSARDAEKQVEKIDILQGTGVVVGVSTITSGQHRQKAVVVKYPIEKYPWGETFRPSISYEKLVDNLPATVDGIAGRGTPSATVVENIPVVVEKMHIELTLNYDCKYRPVPAGCAWRTEAGNACTIGTPVYDNGANEYRLVTASHCFYNYGQECHQPAQSAGGSLIGRRDPNKIDFRHNPLFDAAVVNVYHGNADTYYRFADNTCGSYRGDDIDGSMSEDRLRYLENNNGSLTKQGIRTGITSGPVTFVSSSAFHVNTNWGGGDSGCPFYETFYDEHFNRRITNIAGILRGGANDAQATQIENVENRWNVAV